MKFATVYCQEYFAINTKLAEQLAQVEQLLKTHGLQCAGFQYETKNWLGYREKISWHLRVIGSGEKVGEVTHCINFHPENEMGFHISTWLDDDGYELLSYADTLNEGIYSMLNVSEG